MAVSPSRTSSTSPKKTKARKLLTHWRESPEAFFSDVLGVTPWERQTEILHAVRDHDRVAVRSGHKVGKSNSAAGLALWFLTTRRSARVIMTSSSFDQVKSILWKELRAMHRSARVPLGGKVSLDPRTGLQLMDGREIIGRNTDTPENFAGYSGENILFLLDEGSGIPTEIYDVVEGNRAGGAKLATFSNPTRTSGWFYDAFHTGKAGWKTLHIPSTDSPNVQAGRKLIPGLATREWVDEKRRDWGEDDPRYQVRVLGEFPGQAENTVIGLKAVEAAKARHTTTSPEGRLVLGVDVARYGDDSSVIQPVHGLKALPAKVLQSLDGVEVAQQVIEWVRAYRAQTGYDGRIPVKVDVIGYGSSCFDHLNHSDEAARLGIEPVPVNVAERATALSEEGEGFNLLRDQLWFGLRDWLEAGGSISPAPILEAELVAAWYGFSTRGLIKVASKEEIKKVLKRSTDHADALALAVYDPPSTFADPAATLAMLGA